MADFIKLGVPTDLSIAFLKSNHAAQTTMTPNQIELATI